MTSPLPAEPESAERRGHRARVGGEAIFEPESAEEEISRARVRKKGLTLLVDPDAEDETPPHGNAR